MIVSYREINYVRIPLMYIQQDRSFRVEYDSRKLLGDIRYLLN